MAGGAMANVAARANAVLAKPWTWTAWRAR